MSLIDFYPYIQDILEKNNATFFYHDKKDEENFSFEKINNQNFANKIKSNREKYLKFFIISEICDDVTREMIYKADFNKLVIVGEGGRETSDSIENINLRVLSKTPDKIASKIFNAIKNMLKKDEEIDMGVEGNSKLHNNQFYQKKLVNKKIFKTDFHNDKAPLIKVKK